MDDLTHHVDPGLPGWAWAVLGFVASSLLGMLGWAMRTVRDRDVALAYSKAEADERFTRRDDHSRGCAAHMDQCERAHDAITEAMREHHVSPAHAGSDKRIAVLEAAIVSINDRLGRFEDKLDAVLDEVKERIRS